MMPMGMSAPSPIPTDQQQALQLLLAAKSVLDNAYYTQQQMGA